MPINFESTVLLIW